MYYHWKAPVPLLLTNELYNKYVNAHLANSVKNDIQATIKKFEDNEDLVTFMENFEKFSIKVLGKNKYIVFDDVSLLHLQMVIRQLLGNFNSEDNETVKSYKSKCSSKSKGSRKRKKQSNRDTLSSELRVPTNLKLSPGDCSVASSMQASYHGEFRLSNSDSVIPKKVRTSYVLNDHVAKKRKVDSGRPLQYILHASSGNSNVRGQTPSSGNVLARKSISAPPNVLLDASHHSTASIHSSRRWQPRKPTKPQFTNKLKSKYGNKAGITGHVTNVINGIDALLKECNIGISRSWEENDIPGADISYDDFRAIHQEYKENREVSHDVDGKKIVKGLMFSGKYGDNLAATRFVFLRHQMKEHIEDITCGHDYNVEKSKTRTGIGYKSINAFTCETAKDMLNDMRKMHKVAITDIMMLHTILPQFGNNYLKTDNCCVNLHYFMEELMNGPGNLKEKFDILSDFNRIIASNYKTEKCTQFRSENGSNNGMSLEELKYLFINYLDDGAMNNFISSCGWQNPNDYLGMMKTFLDRLE